MKLSRSFYTRPTLTVAKELLGKYLVYGKKSARICEVEAYIGQNDKACHAACGKTKRNEVMFKKGGYAYIYIIYGIYHCLNITTEKEGFPSAVLIRGLEHPEGNGPGKLCRYFGLTKAQNGLDLTTPLSSSLSDLGVEDKVNPEHRRRVDLTRSKLYIEDRGNRIAKMNIAQAPRIGVDYAGKDAKLPWRFLIK